MVSTSAADFLVNGGPYDLPNDGASGTLTWAQRQEILHLTRVSAAVRDRRQSTGVSAAIPKRHLTLSGPVAGFQVAYEMAMRFVVESQRRNEKFSVTPGCERDWIPTVNQRSEEFKAAQKAKQQAKHPSPMASGCGPASSSWQQHMMQPMMMQPMMMQPMMFVVESQRRNEKFSETPGCEKKRIATENQRSKEFKAAQSVESSDTDSSDSSYTETDANDPKIQLVHAAPPPAKIAEKAAAPTVEKLRLLPNPQSVPPPPGLAAAVADSQPAQPIPSDGLTSKAPPARLRLTPREQPHDYFADEEDSSDSSTDANDPKMVKLMAKTAPGKAAAPPPAKIAEKAAAPTVEKRRTLPNPQSVPPPPGLAAAVADSQPAQPIPSDGLTSKAPPARLRLTPREQPHDYFADEERCEEPVNNQRSLATRREDPEDAKKRRLITYITWKRDVMIRYVHLMSVGWRQPEVRYSRNFDELLNGKQGLMPKLFRQGVPEPDVIIDCRMFESSESPIISKILRHTGHHADIIKDTVEHPKFRPCVRKALDMLHDDVKKDIDLVVLSVCTAGCHRSVALTLILQSIFERMSYNVRVRRLSSGSWETKKLRQHCEACDTNNTLKHAMFKEAFEKIRR